MTGKGELGDSVYLKTLSQVCDYDIDMFQGITTGMYRYFGNRITVAEIIEPDEIGDRFKIKEDNGENTYYAKCISDLPF